MKKASTVLCIPDVVSPMPSIIEACLSTFVFNSPHCKQSCSVSISNDLLWLAFVTNALGHPDPSESQSNLSITTWLGLDEPACVFGVELLRHSCHDCFNRVTLILIDRCEHLLTKSSLGSLWFIKQVNWKLGLIGEIVILSGQFWKIEFLKTAWPCLAHTQHNSPWLHIAEYLHPK